MKKVRRTVFGIISTAAIVSSLGTAAYARDIAEIEDNDTTIEQLSSKSLSGSSELVNQAVFEQAKEKLADRLDNMQSHLQEILDKITSNDKLDDDQKANAGSGIEKVLTLIGNLKKDVTAAATPKDLKRVRNGLKKEAKQFMIETHKKVKELRLQQGKK